MGNKSQQSLQHSQRLSNIRELIALKSEKLKELEGNGDDNNPNIVILRIAISKLKTELERSLEEAVGIF